MYGRGQVHDAGRAGGIQVKGNVFKNKRVLMEAIHLQKAEKAREKQISEQFEARREKGKQTRARKLERRNERLAGVRSCSQDCSMFRLFSGRPGLATRCSQSAAVPSPSRITAHYDGVISTGFARGS